MSYTTPIAIKNMRFYEIMITLQTAPLPAPQLNNDSIKGHQIYMFPFQSRLVLFLAACPAATGPVKCRRFPSMKHPSLMKMPSHTQVTNHKKLRDFLEKEIEGTISGPHRQKQVVYKICFQLFSAGWSVIPVMLHSGNH